MSRWPCGMGRQSSGLQRHIGSNPGLRSSFAQSDLHDLSNAERLRDCSGGTRPLLFALTVGFVDVIVPRNGLAARWRCASVPKLVVSCVLLVAAYNAVQFWDLKIRECFDVDDEQLRYEICPTELRMSEIYVRYYK